MRSGGSPVGPRTDARVREAWAGQPGVLLRSASVVYGAAVEARHALYDLGLLRARRVDRPVISIGGLTAGGSGKTPIAAAVASWVDDAGWRPLMVTAGLSDEIEVHRLLNPGIPVLGGRDRGALIRQEGGQTDVVILDSGFQHRRLYRDLEIVAIDAVALAGFRRRLPAGPFREGLGALLRADIVLLVTRTGKPTGAAFDAWVARWREWITNLGSNSSVLGVSVAPGGLVPVNESAARAVSPAVAVAGVMYPEPFFRTVAALIGDDGSVDRGLTTVPYPDHHPYDEAGVDQLIRLSGSRGIACTLKDAVKLSSLVGERTPLWYLGERVRTDPRLPALVTGALRALRTDDMVSIAAISGDSTT